MVVAIRCSSCSDTAHDVTLAFTAGRSSRVCYCAESSAMSEARARSSARAAGVQAGAGGRSVTTDRPSGLRLRAEGCVITCAHCDCSADESPLFCMCGPTEQHDLCSGMGCRGCGRWGWLALFDEPEHAVEDCGELNALGGYDSAGRGYDAADYAAVTETLNLGRD